MKYRAVFTVLFSSMIMYFAPSLSAQSTTQQQKDSLRQVLSKTEGEEKLKAYSRLSDIYLSEVRQEHVIDTLFTIYDQLDAEAERTGHTDYQGFVRFNKLSALFNKRLYDDVLLEAPAFLTFMEERNLWKYYYQTYEKFSHSYIRKRNFEQALHEGQAVYEHAKERKDTGGMGVALRIMSRIYNGQRRFSDEEKGWRESIELLQDNTNYLDVLADTYYRLGSNLTAQKRYDEALQVGAQCEEINRRYEEESNSSQRGVWLNLWLLYIDIYRQSGEYDKAEMYVNKVDSISNGSIKLYEERAQILYGKKQYAAALEMIDKSIEVASNKLQPKGLKLMILIKMGEAEKANELFSEIIVELDARHNTEYNARLDELRTQYEVDKHIAEKARNRNYFFFALGGCVLLFLLLGITFYYNRLITRKNRSLYKQIQGQNRLEEELARLRNGHESPFPGDKKQRELVSRLREFLLQDRNLSNILINRDELTSVLSTNRNTLSDAVKTVTGKTFMEYIRVIQLEEARRMLDNNAGLTIEAVSQDCGFNTFSTFYRLFRKHYGISPSEYRKMAVSAANEEEDYS